MKPAGRREWPPGPTAALFSHQTSREQPVGLHPLLLVRSPSLLSLVPEFGAAEKQQVPKLRLFILL